MEILSNLMILYRHFFFCVDFLSYLLLQWGKDNQYMLVCILHILKMNQINLEDVYFISETSLTVRGSRRRTTVPKELVDKFNLKDGDRLRWIIFKDGRIAVNCVPAEEFQNKN